MASLITMPKLSDTMEEGGIGAWLKKEGEHFDEGDPLVAIETDKATVEYASPYEGTLLKILIPEGKAAKLKDPIAVYGKQGEAFDLQQLLKGSVSAPQAGPAKAATVANPKTSLATPPVPVDNAASKRIKASPLAKKMAKEQGVNLTLLSGTGTNGRIIARDLATAPSAQNLAPAIARPNQAGDQKIPLSMMRKTIAKRLHAAKNDAPHFYLTVSANMEKILTWRRI